MPDHDGARLQLPWSEYLSPENFNPAESADAAQSNYRIGRDVLTIDSNDNEFLVRFSAIFGDCVVTGTTNNGCTVKLRTQPDSPFVTARFEAPKQTDYLALLLALFPEHRHQELQHPCHGWRLFTANELVDVPILAYRGSDFAWHESYPWQADLAYLALADVMRSQPDTFFFHGATVAVENRGILLSGDKGAGKTTLALALASRGHTLLSDEIAALDSNTGRLLPVRRALSIRSGPQVAPVAQYVNNNATSRIELGDGTHRHRVPVSQMFPTSPARETPFTHLFFLIGFSAQPRIRPIALEAEHLSLLSPFLASVWDQVRGQRTIAFLRGCSRAQCYLVDVGGTPEEMATLIEQIVEK